MPERISIWDFWQKCVLCVRHTRSHAIYIFFYFVYEQHMNCVRTADDTHTHTHIRLVYCKCECIWKLKAIYLRFNTYKHTNPVYSLKLLSFEQYLRGCWRVGWARNEVGMGMLCTGRNTYTLVNIFPFLFLIHALNYEYVPSEWELQTEDVFASKKNERIFMTKILCACVFSLLLLR